MGSLELQNMTEAEIAHSNALPFKYGEHNLADGDTLNVGNVKIKALYTPGHTNESLSYLVYAPESSEATMVFTGDTLFAGSVGRTDLYGKTAQQTVKLKNSTAACMKSCCRLATTFLFILRMARAAFAVTA